MRSPKSFIPGLLILFLGGILYSPLLSPVLAQGTGLIKALVEEKKATGPEEGKGEEQRKPQEEFTVLQEKAQAATEAYEARKQELMPLLTQAKAAVQSATEALAKASSPEETKRLEEELRLAKEWEALLERELSLAEEEMLLAKSRVQLVERRLAFPGEKARIEEALRTKAFTPQDAKVAQEEAKVAAEKVALTQKKLEALQGDIASGEKEVGLLKAATTKAEQVVKELSAKGDIQKDELERQRLESQLQQAKRRLDLVRKKGELAARQLELARGKYELAREELDLLKTQAELFAVQAKTIRELVGVSEEELKAQQEKVVAAQKAAETEKEKAEQERVRAQQELERAQRALEEAKTAKEKATTAEQTRMAELKQQVAELKAEVAKMKAELARERITLAENATALAQKKAEILARKLEAERGTLSPTEILNRYEWAKTEAERAAAEVETAKNRALLAQQELEALKREAELSRLKLQVEKEQASAAPGTSLIRDILRSLEEISRLTQEKAQVAEERATILQEQAQLVAERARVTQELERELSLQRNRYYLWKREPSQISWTALQPVYTDLVNLRSLVIIWLSDLPGQLNALKDSLLASNRLRQMVGQGSLIVVAFLLAMLLPIPFQRGLQRILDRYTVPPPLPLGKKTLRATVRVLYHTLVRAFLLLAGILLFLFVTRGKGMLAVVILLAGLTAYRFIKSVVQELFMPWDPEQRLINCRDSIASYLYRHLLRITIYVTFLPTLIFILKAVEYHEGLIALLWLIFRLGLLLLLVLLTYNKEAMVSLLPRAENRLEKIIYVTATKVYPLFILFIICIVALQSLGYLNLARFLVRSLVLTAIILAAARLIYKGIEKFLRWWLLSEGRVERDLLLSREAAETLYDVLRYVTSYLVYILALFTIVGIWGVDLSGIYATLTSETSRTYLWRFVSAGLVILVSTLLLRLAYQLIDRVFILPPEEARAWRKKLAMGEKGKTIAPLLKDLLRYTTIFIAGVLVLLRLGVDPTPILAGLGVISLALGFGAQTLVRDVISGLFILFEGLIRVGDVVNFGDTAGLVEEVGLRVTKYRQFSGELRVIPNGEIRAFGNFNRQWVRAVVTVGVAYEQDVGKAMRVMEEVGKTWAMERTDIVLETPEVQGILDFADSAITIRLVVKVKPLQHWAAERELRRRIKEAFDREGVEIPFPRRVVYTRQEQNGAETEQQNLALLAEQAREVKEAPSQEGR